LLSRIVVIFTLFISLTAHAASTSAVAWQPWSDAVFDQARREHKLVLLDLEAVWCHWCHVMDEQTYANPVVGAALAKNYIAVKVDHDARPDLAERYREYGWPATIIFDAQGRELVKRAGYIAPDAMLPLLATLVKDPTPEPDAVNAPVRYADSPSLDAATRARLTQRFISSHDFKLGGLTTAQKYLDRDSVEYELLLAQRGDAQAARMARQDLNAGLQLIDPVWGGVYQYSTDGDWQHAHYEKLTAVQADYLRLYALGYALFREPKYRQAAQDIVHYMQRFMRSPQGAFYTSQDADLIPGQKATDYFKLGDAARRARGIPKVDTHLYARENGQMAAALATLYGATGDTNYLDMARTAADWALANRSLPGGGFRHDATDAAGPYLGDTLGMARGLVMLYSVTGERSWLQHATAAADFIAQRFGLAGQAGFVTAVQSGRLKPVALLDENIPVARFYNQLYHYTGQAKYQAHAEQAMKYLATPAIALSRLTEAGILQAAFELANPPTHLTIVGKKDDPQALLLFKTALAFPAIYRRVEWWDKREGAMPNPDVQYPAMPRAAAFVCGDGRCSIPVYDSAALTELAGALTGSKLKVLPSISAGGGG
jgi:uncharacterized protein YyaL (SSP411 family)